MITLTQSANVTPVHCARVCVCVWGGGGGGTIIALRPSQLHHAVKPQDIHNYRNFVKKLHCS